MAQGRNSNHAPPIALDVIIRELRKKFGDLRGGTRPDLVTTA
jgi:hypothetical protein